MGTSKALVAGHAQAQAQQQAEINSTESLELASLSLSLFVEQYVDHSALHLDL